MIRRSKVVNVKLMAMMMIMVMLIFTPSFIFDYFDEEKKIGFLQYKLQYDGG